MSLIAEFVIPLNGVELVTPNKRLHWAVKARMVKEQRRLAGYRARGRSHECDEPRDIHLTLVRGKGQRMLDPDAVPSALKPVLDGIVDAGLLVDDSSRWCNPTYSQIRGPRAELQVRITQP